MWARSEILPLLAIVNFASASRATPFNEYILAPANRTIHAVAVYATNGSVNNAGVLAGDPANSAAGATLNGPSSVTLDFGKNIAGIVSLTSAQSSLAESLIWLTYTESSLWINSEASDGTADAGLDAPLPLQVGLGPGVYTVDRDHERGAFRYLTLTNNGTGTIELSDVAVNFTAAPTQDLAAYTGYFHSNDELLNRVWYAGAYTVQLCTIDPTHGDALIHWGEINSTSEISLPETNTWYNNYTITNGSTCLVDGAKRDRLVWPGDMSISIPSTFYSTYDLDSVRNSIESLIVLQLDNGRFPFVGVPASAFNVTSFTYHLHNLIGIADYYHYSGDLVWLKKNWQSYKRGVAWSLSNVDGSGLMNVTSPVDYARKGMSGHNVAANALLYYVLNRGIELAEVTRDTCTSTNYSRAALGIKNAANELLWDDAAGLFKDNETTTLHPQDGNSFAVMANLTTSSDQASSISAALASRWGPYGASGPEVNTIPATVSPFIGGFELEAHLLAGNASAALSLIRLQWGFMMDDPRMTNSTLIEGYGADGSVAYPSYPSAARVSHAHAWSTAPTSLLPRYVAGIELTGAAGSSWRIKPLLGDLTSVQAGMSTSLGAFQVNVTASASGAVTSLSFQTPRGTTGDVVLPLGTSGTLSNAGGYSVELENGIAAGLGGGDWLLSSLD